MAALSGCGRQAERAGPDRAPDKPEAGIPAPPANPSGEAGHFVTLPSTEALCMITDLENNLYVAGRDKLMKVTPEGAITVLADGFTFCDDLRMDPEGNIYVTDSFENRVYRVTPADIRTCTWRA